MTKNRNQEHIIKSSKIFCKIKLSEATLARFSPIVKSTTGKADVHCWKLESRRNRQFWITMADSQRAKLGQVRHNTKFFTFVLNDICFYIKESR